MKKKMKWILISIGIFFVLIGFLVIGTLFYLESNHFQQFLQTKINKGIPGTISWEKFHFSLIKGKFELSNALLKDPTDGKLAGLDRLFLDLSWLTLLKKELTISELTLEKPWATLEKDKQGNLNLLRAFPPSSPEQKEKPKKEKSKKALPIDIVVQKLEITDASFQYEETAKPLKTVLEDINLKADATLPRTFLKSATTVNGNIDFKIDKGYVENPNIKTDLDQFQIKASLKNGEIDPLICQIGTTPLKLDLSGNIRELFNQEPLLNVSLDLAASLEDIRESLLLKPELSGKVDLALKAEGTANNPQITLDLDYGGGNLVGNQVEQINIDCQLKEKILDLVGLQVNTESGELNLNGDVNLQEAFANGFLASEKNLEAISYHLFLTKKNIILEELLKGKEIKGTVNSNLSLEGKGVSPKTLSAKLALELFGDNFTTSQVAPVDIHLKANANLDNGVAVIKELNAKAGDINLQAEGDFNFSSQAINAKLGLDAPEIEKSLTPLGIKDIFGKLGLKANVSGVVKQPVFDVALQGEKLRFKEITIGDIDLDAALDKTGLLNVAKLSIENQGTELDLKGTVQIFKGALNAVDKSLPLNLSLLLRNGETKDFLNKELPGGVINGELKAEGNLNNLAAGLSLQGKGIAVNANQIGDVNLDLRLSEGKLFVDKADVQNQNSSLQLSGTAQILEKTGLKPIKAPIVDINLKSEAIFLQDFIEKLKGEIALNADVKGSLSNQNSSNTRINGQGNQNTLNAAISLQGKGVAVNANQIGDVNLDFRLSEGKLFVDKADVRNQDSSLQLSGTAQILEKTGVKPIKDPVFDINLESKAIFLENFIEKLKGKIALNANLKGSLSNPNGPVNLDAVNLDLGAQKLESVKLISNLDGKKINIDSLQVAFTPEEIIEGSGWVSLEKAFDVVLTSKGISLNRIDTIREKKIADGKILLDISGKGTFDNPEVKGNLSLNHLRVKGKPMDDLNLTLLIQDQLAQISGKAAFDLDAAYHLQEKDFSAVLLFNKTNLLPYFKLANQNDLSGFLTGKVEAKGNATAVKEIEAVVDVSDLNLSFKDKELIQTKNLKASFKNGAFSIPGTLFHLMKTGQLQVSGTGKGEGPFDLTIKGDIPVSLINGLVENAPEMGGNLLISGKVKGTASQPDINAEIELKKIGMTIPGLLQKLHDVNGKIQVTPKAIVIKKIEGQLDTGQFDLAGKIDLKAFQPTKANVSLNLHSLPVNYPDMLDMLLNANLKASGTPEKTLLTGEIVILDGQYYKDVNLSMVDMLKGATKKKRETAPSAPAEIKIPFLKNMDLDIIVKRRNPFMIENNLAQVDIHPDLQVKGKLNRPLVSGRAEIGSGTITYQKKTFDVQRGVIDFLNPYKIEPTLDIESEVIVRDWTIYLTISGTPEALNFKLTSDPAEEHGDILSLLLIGRTAKELTNGSGGGSSQSPAQMVAELVAKTVGKNVKDATGLDILEVDFNNGDEGDSSSEGVKVTIGKELSRRMTVKYAVESKNGEMTQRAIAEYKFLENVLLSGFQDNKGTFGGEIQFRLEFR